MPSVGAIGNERDKRPLCGAESRSARDVANMTSSPLRNDTVWKNQCTSSLPQVLHAALPYILKASARMTPPSFLTSCRPLAEPVSDDTVLDAHTVFTCPRPRPCHRTPRYLCAPSSGRRTRTGPLGVRVLRASGHHVRSEMQPEITGAGGDFGRWRRWTAWKGRVRFVAWWCDSGAARVGGWWIWPGSADVMRGRGRDGVRTRPATRRA